jgi:hypothetical protein
MATVFRADFDFVVHRRPSLQASNNCFRYLLSKSGNEGRPNYHRKAGEGFHQILSFISASIIETTNTAQPIKTGREKVELCAGGKQRNVQYIQATSDTKNTIHVQSISNLSRSE